MRSFLELYNVEYFRGSFPSAAPAADDDTRYAFVHLDADTYQSGLEYFLPASSRTEYVSWMITVGSIAPAWNWPSATSARTRTYRPASIRRGSGSDAAAP